MKGIKKISTLFVVALMLPISAIAFAQPGPGGRHKGEGPELGFGKHGMHGFGIERFADELGLTNDQLTKLKALRSEGEKEAVAKRAEVKIAHIELRELMDADKPNESAIKKQVEKIGALKTAMMLAMVDKKLAVKKILTDEQEAKLKELRKERFKDCRPGERKGRRGFGYNDDAFDGYFFGGINEPGNFDAAPGQEL